METTKEELWLQKHLFEFAYCIPSPIFLLCNNQSIIKLTTKSYFSIAKWNTFLSMSNLFNNLLKNNLLHCSFFHLLVNLLIFWPSLSILQSFCMAKISSTFNVVPLTHTHNPSPLATHKRSTLEHLKPKMFQFSNINTTTKLKLEKYFYLLIHPPNPYQQYSFEKRLCHCEHI